jgi:hypothetical protein
LASSWFRKNSWMNWPLDQRGDGVALEVGAGGALELAEDLHGDGGARLPQARVVLADAAQQFLDVPLPLDLDRTLIPFIQGEAGDDEGQHQDAERQHGHPDRAGAPPACLAHPVTAL